MNTLKEIFEKIEGRDWDNFGYKNKENGYINREEMMAQLKKGILSGDFCSLADLLANKSWCKAVWGEERTCRYCGGELTKPPMEACWCDRNAVADGEDEVIIKWCEFYSTKAFQILQQEGRQQCIDYIIKTMI